MCWIYGCNMDIIDPVQNFVKRTFTKLSELETFHTFHQKLWHMKRFCCIFAWKERSHAAQSSYLEVNALVQIQSALKWKKNEGVFLNAHSSPTKNLYPAWAGETVSRQIHILITTNTPVNTNRIQYFSYNHGNRVIHTCKKTKQNINNMIFYLL